MKQNLRFSKVILLPAAALLITCAQAPEAPVRSVFPWNPPAMGAADYTQFVDPFIGTGGHGHTFPGATAPFGMVQLSPDTRNDGSWDGCSGYHYSDSILFGFSHTHLSGTGCSDYGDILLMPYSRKACPKAAAEAYVTKTKFQHSDEQASPGYYTVKLPQAKAELTCSPRVGFHRYTFSADDPAIEFNLEHRDEVLDSEIEIVDDSTIRGYRFSKAWATNQRLFYYARFSVPFRAHIYEAGREVKAGGLVKGKHLRAALKFDSKNVLVKVAVSPVSMFSAENNMKAEIPGWNFDGIRDKVKRDWNNELSRIEVKGGTKEQQRTFYTALYHCFIAPNVYSDVNGGYRGRDSLDHIDTSSAQHTVFSLWDTYRGLHPLFTIVQQKRTNDFIRTFIRQWEQGGRLPVWELSACETECMIGYHAVPVIADAYIKGIKDYDTIKAYQAMAGSAMRDHFGLKSYKSCGYIPAEGEAESVSKTLEYAYDDWCIAQVAKKLKLKEEYAKYIKRAQAWENLFDPQSGFMRARLNNAFVEPFAPEEVNFHFTEANAWQYSLAVPHDIGGLTERMGGKEKFKEHLDKLFSASSKTSGREQADITGLIGQYAHGNEPSHHMAYLYNYCDAPVSTQYKVNEILTTLYKDTPDGLCGNEDCGQMSAWFVLSAMGFYPVTPGTEQYAFGTPLFTEVKINLENGKQFIITSDREEDRFLIEDVKLNGKTYNENFINHSELMKGGTLHFDLGEKTERGNLPMSAVPAVPGEDRILPVPRVLNSARTFEEEMYVEFYFLNPGGISYSVNDGPAEQYRSAFRIERTSKIKAWARGRYETSDTAVFIFYRSPKNRNIKLNTGFAPQYAAGGEKALIDFIRGPENFRTGSWQGYQEVNLDAVIDLSSEQEIRSVKTGFLQDENSWIFMPVEVEYFISSDGKAFKSIGKVKNDIPATKTGTLLKDFTLKTNVKARYVKVIARNNGKCPPGHKAAGEKAWIFADEILIE
ncbi:MAG: alpha-1,2-mannosidase [Bacteroidetes bacterium]|nr:MAG: alpha-1,2-mannosidase [Bacteroidota bacterium]